jgi:hypothetical protein
MLTKQTDLFSNNIFPSLWTNFITFFNLVFFPNKINSFSIENGELNEKGNMFFSLHFLCNINIELVVEEKDKHLL